MLEETQLKRLFAQAGATMTIDDTRVCACACDVEAQMLLLLPQ